MKLEIFSPQRSRGFALVITLSLMILLTVIAVGLLTLSTVSLRASSQGDAMQVARANARVALMLAIGDLQRQLGPDTRISTTADQIATADGSVSSTPQTQRQWSGAYKAWPAGLPADARPAPEFLQWFVSGSPTSVSSRSFAGTSVGTDPKTSVEIVSSNSVGAGGDTVRIPLLSHTEVKGMKNNFAWWVSDLGSKALIAPAKVLPTDVAGVRADQQVAPGNNLKAALAGTAKPFATLAVDDARLVNVASWQTSALLADSPQNIRGLFHDLTSQSRGLLTNVRTGGFRKDLSMELERSATSTSGASKPPDPTATALYRVGGETGINLQELFTYYNLSTTSNSYSLRTTGSATFTTGGSVTSGTPHLRVSNDAAACRNDPYFFFKQPVVINYQLIFSFKTVSVPVVPATTPPTNVDRLHLVADPVITLWNPLDVPVVVPTSAYFTVKYWQVPYDLSISVNGTAYRTFPMAATLSGATATSDGDGNFLSLRMGELNQLVFKPGEVIKMSQSGNTLVKNAGAADRHILGGRKGFNFGGGVALPVRDQAGKFADLKPTDVITYRAVPNQYTAGATNTSGRSIKGGANHTRHFSLTHHEYYIGNDRDSNSLGIGNMAIDWDFGDRRLRPTDIRGDSGTGIKGTKDANQRLYANESRFSDIFKSVTNGRDMPASALKVEKLPFMILSFNAKTENGSDLGTRYLSRFNPKALHVDFFDLSEKERDMLPYEYVIEGLDGWKNRSLEVSTNGNGYYGGGMTATDGTSFLSTHSVPREPIISLAAFQHSFANGFEMNKPRYGYAALNAREPLLPQISHAIGNSMACPVLAPGAVEGSLPGGRPLADHSYLANQALWDDWFLSGIAPQDMKTFSKSRTQKVVATEFFDGTAKLPVVGYTPDLRGKEPAQIVSTYFSGTTPSTAATNEMASLIRVDGMFNVNSTSVEAWKNLLGARQNRPVVIRDATGNESTKPGQGDTPVTGLLTPQDLVASGSGNVDTQDLSQWVGRRTLSDPEIEQLARAIVKEVRKRGPFLSLADFVNRRVGTNQDLARCGAIQSALDSAETDINSAYNSGPRAVESTTSARFAFARAEEGPLGFGSPGIVKQADILTPIAPLLSARSDSFLIRGYGEKVDASGKVIARAWCEAVVQRSPEFIDSSDAPEKVYSSINTLNQIFGRRFDIVSFRWLNATEV